MTEPNVPMLRKAVEWVEYQDALPEIDREWDQELYLTSAHGRASYLVYDLLGESVAELSVEEFEKISDQIAPHCGTAYCVAGYVAMLTDERYTEQMTVDGVHSSDLARRVLGLTREQAEDLFSGSNKAADVRRIAEEAAGEKL